MKKKRIVRVFWLVLFFFPLCMFLINIMVDPFWYFNLFHISFFSKYKPQFANEARMAKVQNICRQKPSNIILGGSRAELGFSTTHPGWKNYPGVTYNIGLAGTGIWEMNQTLQHSYYASGNLKLAVISLDFLMFNRNLEDVVFNTIVVGFDSKRLITSKNNSCAKIFRYDFDRLLGYQALRNSYESVIRYLNIKPSTHVDYRRDGRMLFTFRDQKQINHYAIPTSKNLMAFTPAQAINGQEIAFIQKTWRAGSSNRYCFTRIDGTHSTFDDFADMLKFAREHHIELKFIISPEHANMMIALQEAGLWMMFEDWKRKLVSVNEKVAREYHEEPYKIWDFSGFNKITTVLTENLFYTYYWEASHYKEILGNRMLDVVLNNKPPADGFGTLITTANIEQHLDETLAAGKIYGKSEYATSLKKAIVQLFNKFHEGEGSTCGFPNEILYQAKESTDPQLIQASLSKAMQLYKAEEKRYQDRGVPYRENTFLHQYSLASRNHFFERPLATWEQYQARAVLELERNDTQLALNDFDQAIQRCSMNAALFFQRGSLYMKRKQYDKAIEDFSEAIKMLPENSSLYFQRGMAFLESKQYAKAADDFSLGLKFDPKNSTLQFLYHSAISAEQANKKSSSA